MPMYPTMKSCAAAAIAALALTACSRSPDSTANGDAVTCNRQCLIDATDAYIAAMVAHDPSRAPLAGNVAFVENITKMQPVEGVWKTLVKGPDSFAIHVPDEINQTAGFLGMMTHMAAPPAPQGT